MNCEQVRMQSRLTLHMVKATKCRLDDQTSILGRDKVRFCTNNSYNVVANWFRVSVGKYGQSVNPPLLSVKIIWMAL
jgi:hypothetical protein